MVGNVIAGAAETGIWMESQWMAGPSFGLLGNTFQNCGKGVDYGHTNCNLWVTNCAFLHNTTYLKAV